MHLADCLIHDNFHHKIFFYLSLFNSFSDARDLANNYTTQWSDDKTHPVHVTGDMVHYLMSQALDMGLGDFNRKNLIAATFMKEKEKGNPAESGFLFVCLFVCVCLSVCLSVYLSIILSSCLSFLCASSSIRTDKMKSEDLRQRIGNVCSKSGIFCVKVASYELLLLACA